MNRLIIRTFISLIWIVSAIICLANSEFLMATLFLLVGVVFAATAKKESNRK